MAGTRGGGVTGVRLSLTFGVLDLALALAPACCALAASRKTGTSVGAEDGYGWAGRCLLFRRARMFLRRVAAILADSLNELARRIPFAITLRTFLAEGHGVAFFHRAARW